MPLAFAPFRIFPLAIVLLALLFVLWMKASPGRAAWRGYLFGLGMFGVGSSWIYVSLHNYGNMPVLLAGTTVLLFTGVLAAFPAAVGWAQSRWFCKRDALHALLILPALWVLLEWLRGWILTGFPWLNLGYSQVGAPLSGLAPWLGVYGVTWATALSAALLLQTVRDRRRLWKLYLPVFALVWVVGWVAGTANFARPIGPPLTVALVQANIALGLKWRDEYRPVILERYLKLSAKSPDAKLVIWPEAAMPAYLDQIDPAYIARLYKQSQRHDRDFLIGVVERDLAAGTFYNSVVSIGSNNSTYRKQHLVPLGEFLPLKGIMSWLLNYLQIPMSDFTAGPRDQSPMRAAGQAIAVSICYEDAFGQEVIRMLPQASLLVNVSEDAWFGDSLAPHQRLQMARMRAMETARTVLRVSNTGLSAMISPRGDIEALAPQFVPMMLQVQAQPMQGATPYVRLGNWTIIATMAALIVIGWLREGGMLVLVWSRNRRSRTERVDSESR
ncbi:MAG: apolipoprotein N-acyltransferase [Acidiferrobacterales bacterium]